MRDDKRELVAALPPSRQDAAAMAGVTPLKILSELMRIAMVDIGDAFTDDGQLKPLKEMPVDVRRAIAAIDVSEIYEGAGENRRFVGLLKKVKFWDKQRALETLAKHLGLLVERVRVEDKDDDLADLIRAARKRAAMAPPLERSEVVDEGVSAVAARLGPGTADDYHGHADDRRADDGPDGGDDRERPARPAGGAAHAGEPGGGEGL
jgi:phage terminase small subunit